MEDLAKLFDTLFAALNSIVTGFLHSLLDVAHDLLGIDHLCPRGLRRAFRLRLPAQGRQEGPDFLPGTRAEIRARRPCLEGGAV